MSWKRLIVALSGALLLAACGDGLEPVGTTRAPLIMAPANGVPGQYMVVFKPGVNDSRGLARALIQAHGGTLGFVYGTAIKGFSAELPDAALQGLQHHPQVAYIEQDQTISVHGTQTAPGLPWGLDRIDQRDGLDGSYTFAYDGTGIHAYVIDTGIEKDHVDFGGRVAASINCQTASDVNGCVAGGDDCDGHGTHVAGTIGGATYGVAKNVTLHPVRVLDCSGRGTWSGVAAGVDWVAANHVAPAVANMSLGGGYSLLVNTAVTNLVTAGVPTAVAAGNESKKGGPSGDACNYSPAMVATAMTVGATDSNDVRPYWSNWGDCVDWFAPGVGITSAAYNDLAGSATMSGTSMASPHVAGVAALYLQQNPGSSPADVMAGLAALTTKGIVGDARSANDNLLFFGDDTPPPPPPPAACGDDTAEGNEVCDGTDLAGETCASQGFWQGTLACNATCDGFDTSACVDSCGDGQINGDDECDGTNLGSNTCQSVDEIFDGGTLSCKSDCTFDTSGCTASCGLRGDSCSSDADCCTGRCHPAHGYCK